MKEFTVGHITALDNAPPDAGRFDSVRVAPNPSGDNVGYGIAKTPVKDIDQSRNPQMEAYVAGADVQKDGVLFTEHNAEVLAASIGDVNSQARMMMVGLDPLLRKLPYEQRSAVLLNLLVTYASEIPAAQMRRGKFIKAMTEEFAKRLRMFLPLATEGQDQSAD